MTRNESKGTARTAELNRREFIEASSGVAALTMVGWAQSAGAQQGWNQGQLAHLIPPPAMTDF